MIVDVIAVGTELLLGQTVNTNASHIAGRLADEGFDAHFQVTVGDNLARMWRPCAARWPGRTRSCSRAGSAPRRTT